MSEVAEANNIAIKTGPLVLENTSYSQNTEKTLTKDCNTHSKNYLKRPEFPNVFYNNSVKN